MEYYVANRKKCYKELLITWESVYYVKWRNRNKNETISNVISFYLKQYRGEKSPPNWKVSLIGRIVGDLFPLLKTFLYFPRFIKWAYKKYISFMNPLTFVEAFFMAQFLVRAHKCSIYVWEEYTFCRRWYSTLSSRLRLIIALLRSISLLICLGELSNTKGICKNIS